MSAGPLAHDGAQATGAVRREVVVALVLVALGATVAGGAIATIEPGVTTDPLGPAAVPAWLGWGIALCGILLLAGALLPGAAKPATGLLDLVDPGADDAPAGPFSPARLALGIAVTAAYIAAFEPLGYLLATPPYLAGLLLLHGGAGRRTLFIAPVLVTVALYLPFQVGLKVPLPGGPLEALFLR